MKMFGTLGRAMLASFEAVGQVAGLRVLLAATVGLAAAWVVRALAAGTGRKAKSSPRDDRSRACPLAVPSVRRQTPEEHLDSTASSLTPASPRPPNR